MKAKNEIRTYPHWDTSDTLACTHLRINEVYADYDFRKDWIAKENDPCPKCDNTSCHNNGKPFDRPNRLTIEKYIDQALQECNLILMRPTD